MAEQSHEFTGKTVDEAVAEGENQLRLNRNDVSVEILSKGDAWHLRHRQQASAYA